MNINHKYKLLLIFIITIIAYLPTLNNDFTNWDDDHQVLENTDIKELSIENIITIFTSSYVGMYQPVTTLCFAVEYSLFRSNPSGYHIVSLLFHLLNITLVFWLIFRLMKKKDIALIVALLFAVHPMFVEAVAWVSARSTLLYSFFYLSSVISYLYYLQHNSIKYLITSILFFILSVLSKSMAVTLPILLLLCDFYRNRKLLSEQVILEKIPFVILSFTFGLVTILLRESAIEQTVGRFSIIDRFFLVPYQLLWYVGKFVVPINLSAYYPNPVKINGFLPVYYYFSPIVLPLLVLIIFKLNKLRKEITFSILFFIITISIVLKVYDFGDQIVTDRYTYIPYIGLFLIIGIIYKQVTDQNCNLLKPIQIVLLCLVLLFAVLTFNRVKIWNNSISLWDDVIMKYNNIAIAYNNRGLGKELSGNIPEALEDYNVAINLNPEFYLPFVNRGNLFFKSGNYEEALRDFNTAIRFNPDFDRVYNNRGTLRMKSGDHGAALRDYNTAIELNPKFAQSYYNRGVVKREMGDLQGALTDYNTAIKLNNKYNDAYYNRGLLKGQQLGDLHGAIDDLNNAIYLDHSKSEYFECRAIINSLLKKHTNALKDYNIAIQMDNENSNAYLNRARLFLELEEFEKAKQDVNSAQRLGCSVSPKLIKNINNGCSTNSK